jgi:hypothetical protein
MSLIIYGRSDDLIEVEGDVRNEFVSYEVMQYLHVFGAGQLTVVKIGYDVVPDKGWHIEVVSTSLRDGACVCENPDMDDGEHYSDRLVINDQVTCVECWGSANGPTRNDMDFWFSSFEARHYPLARLVAAYRALTGS